MREYHKIETVFERSTDGNKYLQLGKFRNPTVKFLKDLPWQFTEKLAIPTPVCAGMATRFPTAAAQTVPRCRHP